MKLYRFLPFLLLLLVVGCSKTTVPVAPIKITAEEVTIPVFHPPLPDAIVWRDFEWKVLTPDRMAELLDSIDRGEEPAMAYYSLTTEQYEVLTLNMAEIKQFLKQQRAIIDYYRQNVKRMAAEKQFEPEIAKEVE